MLHKYLCNTKLNKKYKHRRIKHPFHLGQSYLHVITNTENKVFPFKVRRTGNNMADFCCYSKGGENVWTSYQ